MAAWTLTDVQIHELLSGAKHVENSGSRLRSEGKHLRRDYRVLSDDGRHEFVLFTRQSTVIVDVFSAGLRWKSKSGEEVILMRCNGSDQVHRNSIERSGFDAQPHVHQATERYISAGKKTESFAMPTDVYSTLAGALHELAQPSNVSGLQTTPDQPELFPRS